VTGAAGKQDGRSDRQGRGRENRRGVRPGLARLAPARGSRVLLATTDPAAHIGSVLSADVSSEVRPVRATGLFAVRDRPEGERPKRTGQDPLPGRASATPTKCSPWCGRAGVPSHGGDGGFEESPAWWSGTISTPDPRHGPHGAHLAASRAAYDYARQVEMMVAVGRTTPGRPAPRGSSTRSYGA